MAKLIATYKQPTDEAAFNAYYFQTHVPLAKTLPGLRSYEISRGDVLGGGGKHDAFMVALLGFDSLDAIQNALGSPQGQATAADLANFAMAGVDLMMVETEMI
jgi:uncharacterized protein (TIGR02118 family)